MPLSRSPAPRVLVRPRTADIPTDIGSHTIEDGQLLFCAHTMWFPVVGYQFDVRNCRACDYFKPARYDGQSIGSAGLQTCL